MFGKSSRMSATGKFVMSQGRKAGNLKAPVIKEKSGKPMPVKSTQSLKPRHQNKAPGVVQR